MRIRPGIELGNLSDTGCRREENEDYYCYAEPEDDEQFERKGRLIVVADGMGGYRGGGIASGIAVDVIRASYLASTDADPQSALLDAFSAADRAIREFAREHPDYSGLGTTCTVALLRQGELSYIHVGDSRLYLVRDSRISRLTRDHTVTQRLIDQGELTPEQAMGHADFHVLTAALGAGDSVQVELSHAPLVLQSGDILLLCTDGLHDLVSDEELRAAALDSAPGVACRKLVETAKARGGHDNITIQILKFVSAAPAQRGAAGHGR